jgi:hypothetical protein
VIASFITILVGTGYLSSKMDSAADRTIFYAGTTTDKLIPKFQTLSKIGYKIIRL